MEEDQPDILNQEINSRTVLGDPGFWVALVIAVTACCLWYFYLPGQFGDYLDAKAKVGGGALVLITIMFTYFKIKKLL